MKKNILYSKASAAIISVALSITLLVGWFPTLCIGWLPIMCYAENAPEPDVPLITYGEFPFTAVYEVDGKEYTIEDIAICEYAGSRWNEGDGKKHRIWEMRFESGPYIALCPIDPSEFVGADEAYVALNVGYSAGQLMGDSESNKHKDAFLYLQLGHNGYGSRSSEEIYESYGAKLISFELHAQPIENTFVPAE